MMNQLKNLFWSNQTENFFLDESQASSDVVTVYRGTQNPTRCWEELRVKQTHFKKDLLQKDTPIYEDKIRFVCMSDTHNRTNRMPPGFVPPGDVFLHAGDFSMKGKMQEIEEFNGFLGTLPHRHKIVIAGNHDMTFDEDFLIPSNGLGRQFNIKVEDIKAHLKNKGIEQVAQLLTNCTYVQDAEVNVAGVRIYGSPWQPEFGNWGFNLPRGKPLLDKWNKIPEGIDILITHGPPVGHGDTVSLLKLGGRAGCVELLNTIQKRVKPQYHVFGHIHEGHGDCTFDRIRAGCVELLNTIQNRVRPSYHIFGHIHEGYGVTSDGHTAYINASTCDLRYRPLNPPIIFDIPLKAGYTKDDIKFVTFDRSDTNNQESLSFAASKCKKLADTEQTDEEFVFFEDSKETSDMDTKGWDSDECLNLSSDGDDDTDQVNAKTADQMDI